MAPVTRNILGYIHYFICSRRDSASRFATVSKDEILAVNEAAAPTNTKKEKKNWLVGVYWSLEKNFLTEFGTNDPRNIGN